MTTMDAVYEIVRVAADILPRHHRELLGKRLVTFWPSIAGTIIIKHKDSYVSISKLEVEQNKGREQVINLIQDKFENLIWKISRKDAA